MALVAFLLPQDMKRPATDMLLRYASRGLGEGVEALIQPWLERCPPPWLETGRSVEKRRLSFETMRLGEGKGPFRGGIAWGAIDESTFATWIQGIEIGGVAVQVLFIEREGIWGLLDRLSLRSEMRPLPLEAACTRAFLYGLRELEMLPLAGNAALIVGWRRF
ncbi:MAG: hypothetical protein RMJ84_05460 [Sandaracinaceae bacterium]|nr:hypothetical protein [Sandaracinaceae bacterium]